MAQENIIYNATPPTLQDGQRTSFQVDENGNLKTTGGSFGSVSDASETDPTEDATIISLLKGILEVLNSHTTILTAIETNTGTP